MVRRTLGMLGLWVLCQVANVVAAIWMLFAIVAGSDRAWTLAKSYDQLGNAAFGGHEDELISSRAGRAKRRGVRWACVLCRLLDVIDKGHCEKTVEVQFTKSDTISH